MRFTDELPVIDGKRIELVQAQVVFAVGAKAECLPSQWIGLGGPVMPLPFFGGGHGTIRSAEAV